MSTSPGFQSFPVDFITLDADAAKDEVDEEIHRDEDVTIKVTQSPGFLCHIEATAAFRMPARTLFKQVITHPDNAIIFRHMDRCSYRRVLQDDGQGRRKVKVAHEASWRFLWMRGTFTTKLDVEEDDNELVMDFWLDPSGGSIMKKFHGRWRIRPHPKDPEHASISTLDQDLAVNLFAPPPLDRLFKRVCCNQIKKIFEDVQREAAAVNKGKPSLCPWEEVQDKQIGVQESGKEDEGQAAAAAAKLGPSAPVQQAEAGAAELLAPSQAAVTADQEPGPTTEVAAEELAGLQLEQK